MTEQSAEYLIRKGGAYYRPNAEGYTNDRRRAGRFTLAEAISHSHPNGPDGPRDGITYEAAPAVGGRVTFCGKQIMIDGKHLADAASPEAAEAIAICLNHADPAAVDEGTWLRGDDLVKVEALFA
ncbi:hypothetical protein HNO88_003008 [Novosphingobium chloroacetimidivorans]|uniref:Uncharacterized protein n=1 Tax=Novosphingobium chloroacetimidivorans TaxID=1428314 RepID=A0A7W7KBA9_9SPHN|nr:hypothetical protein [Novosphingobium chloroacetimidivorans]MBB4859679.1 hypothetical protein [Novosphingobium chloroacetimidivorans]